MHIGKNEAEFCATSRTLVEVLQSRTRSGSWHGSFWIRRTLWLLHYDVQLQIQNVLVQNLKMSIERLGGETESISALSMVEPL